MRDWHATVKCWVWFTRVSNFGRRFDGVSETKP